MDLMKFRRRILTWTGQLESWDYVLLPVNELNEVPALKIDVAAGQTIRINYFQTEGRGYVYDGRNCGLSYLGYPSGGSASRRSVIDEDTTIEVTTTKAGVFTFSIVRTGTPNAEGLAPSNRDRFCGYYIKIKLL